MFFEVLSGRIEKGTLESAAFDLFYEGKEPIEVYDKPVAIPTGLRTSFSPELVAVIKEKSGLALHGLEVKGGVIDADYRDEWKVIVRNPIYITQDPWTGAISAHPDWNYIKIEPGMKVAQFLLLEIPKVNLLGKVTLKENKRTGGFGSTGTV